MDAIHAYMPLTPDLQKERVKAFKQMFPDLFTNEGEINLDEVKKVFGQESSSERYEFNWYGKAKAKRDAFSPGKATLKFDSKKSVNASIAPHVIIEGENLEVLKLLLSGYREKIKCIYIDPPYNTGNDFVYSDWYGEGRKAYWEQTNSTEEGVRIDSNPDTEGRFHSKWLSMLYSRLLLARQLLRPDGAIFISIDDHEIHNLRKLADEVFGEENYRNTFSVRRYDKNINRQFLENGLTSFNTGFEYVVCYSKTEAFRFNPVYKETSDDRKNFGYWKGFWNDADRPTMRYDILGYEPRTGQWKWSTDRGLKAVENYKLYCAEFSDKLSLEEYWESTGKKLEFIRRNMGGEGKNKGVEHWIPPSGGILRNTLWQDVFASKATPEVSGLFDFPKNTELIKNLISSCESSGDIILDFFAGSGSTGQAVMEMNAKDGGERKCILVQLPEKINPDSEIYQSGFKTISSITIERCKRVVQALKQSGSTDTGFKVYYLAKSNFPRVEFSPDPDKSQEQNLRLFKKYMAEKEAGLQTLFNRDELITEVLLKNGFTLNYHAEKQDQFSKNEVLLATDGEQKALICLDSFINNNTVAWFQANNAVKFICLERALDTTKKWNLKKYLQEKFYAI